MRNSTIKPYRFGTCIECEQENKKLISKRCFEPPNFCYQKHQKQKYVQKQKLKETTYNKKTKEKSIPELLKLATIVFNRWIRNRDTIGGTHFICISCDRSFTLEKMQAGHYMPSTVSELRFNEMNVHGECIECNCHDTNHLIGYRKNISKKIGQFNLKWLESHKISDTHKWSKQELLDIINKYK